MKGAVSQSEMISQSVIEKILKNLAIIYKQFEIHISDRNGAFSFPVGSGGEYLPDGVIVVDIGNISKGTAYRLNYDCEGELVMMFSADSIQGEIIYTQVSN